ncbi:hypothetical protein [Methylibium sp. Root1272]|uniref:hypothetical protein n=1 Tax=Methylibium sp. Root1272 TaxID=1736441 RepID=UPI0006FF024F|nr:hypothetical protein [Methylibium sp. Root1272]KQW69839.1 hypothetical protein ASC67_04955 [Methylibium sp. Root1272]
MNAPLLPEVLLGPRRDDEPALPLETEGVQRYVWEGAFGPMLIEVREGAAFVNGQRVTSIGEMREASVAGQGTPPAASSGDVSPPDGSPMTYRE